jgi:hypothetical protein
MSMTSLAGGMLPCHDASFGLKKTRIISKRVGVILRVQGSKDFRVQVKCWMLSSGFRFNPSPLPGV